MYSMWSFFYPIVSRKKDVRKDEYFKEIQLQGLAGTELVTWSSTSVSRSSFTSDDTLLQEDKPACPLDCVSAEQELRASAEQAFFVRYLQATIQAEPNNLLAAYHQLDTLSSLCRDGVVICVMLSKLGPDYLDGRAINTAKSFETAMPRQQMLENAALLLNTVRSLGCRVDSVAPMDVVSGKVEALVKLLSELLQYTLTQPLCLSCTPQLRHVVHEAEMGEVPPDLEPGELLLRWANWHLARCESDGQPHLVLTDLSVDLADGRALMELLSRIALPEQQEALAAAGRCEECEERLTSALALCRELGCVLPLLPEDLAAGSALLGFALLADLFAARHGLPDVDPDDLMASRRMLRSRSMVVGSSREEGSEDPGAPASIAVSPAGPRAVRRLVSGSVRYAASESLAGDDEELGREERTLRLWLNSLGCPTPFPTLYSEPIRHGWVLLEAVEVLRPGSVDWGAVHSPAAIAAAKPIVRWIWAVENCQYAVELCMQRLSASLVGISGADIARGRRTAILALVWQLMHFHTLQVLQSLLGPCQPPRMRPQPQQQETSEEASDSAAAAPQDAPSTSDHPSSSGAGGSSATPDTPRTPMAAPHRGDPGEPAPGKASHVDGDGRAGGASQQDSPSGSSGRVSEQDLLRWANWRLSLGGSCIRLDSFRDSCISKGLVLLELLAAIQPTAVDPAFVSPGDTFEERRSNARYVISVARKLGCGIFVLWEDLVEARPRMVLILLAALCALDRERRACRAAAEESSEARRSAAREKGWVTVAVDGHKQQAATGEDGEQDS